MNQCLNDILGLQSMEEFILRGKFVGCSELYLLSIYYQIICSKQTVQCFLLILKKVFIKNHCAINDNERHKVNYIGEIRAL